MIEETNANGFSVEPGICMAIVEKAIAAGHDRRLLRWRVSPAMGFAMNGWKWSGSTDNRDLARDLDSGIVYESGTFVGIPFAIDRSLATDRVFLDVLAATPFMSIAGFSIPLGYEL